MLLQPSNSGKWRLIVIAPTKTIIILKGSLLLCGGGNIWRNTFHYSLVYFPSFQIFCHTFPIHFPYIYHVSSYFFRSQLVFFSVFIGVHHLEPLIRRRYGGALVAAREAHRGHTLGFSLVFYRGKTSILKWVVSRGFFWLAYKFIHQLITCEVFFV